MYICDLTSVCNNRIYINNSGGYEVEDGFIDKMTEEEQSEIDLAEVRGIYADNDSDFDTDNPYLYVYI